MIRAKRTSQILDIEAIRTLLGIGEYEDPDQGDLYSQVYRQAVDEGATDDEATLAATEAEATESESAYKQWRNAFEYVAEWYFEQHGLVLDWRHKKGVVRVDPATTWLAAAAKIRTTIDGVGMFAVGSTVREFLEIDCRTAREAVLNHLGSIPDYGRIYGWASPDAMLGARLR